MTFDRLSLPVSITDGDFDDRREFQQVRLTIHITRNAKYLGGRARKWRNIFKNFKNFSNLDFFYKMIIKFLEGTNILSI